MDVGVTTLFIVITKTLSTEPCKTSYLRTEALYASSANLNLRANLFVRYEQFAVPMRQHKRSFVCAKFFGDEEQTVLLQPDSSLGQLDLVLQVLVL